MPRIHRKIRGRLSAELSQSELEGTLGRIAGCCSVLVRTRRWDLSGGQPTHQTRRFLGVAHRRGEAAIPRHRFLSEAFTKPNMMQELAKVGYTQSYTYFTWRNTKHELTEYLTELTQGPMKEYFRANFFANTPDILPEYLQHGGRPAFLIRAALAALTMPVYGIYSGFELCENAPVPGKEEYIDSEKYQFKGRDWNAPGNIKDYVTKLNKIRRENRALREYANLQTHTAENDQILCFSKTTTSLDEALLVAVTVDPRNTQTAFVHVPLAEFGLTAGEVYQVEDLITGERYAWQGSRNFISLDPHSRPAHVFRIRRSVARVGGEDIFA